MDAVAAHPQHGGAGVGQSHDRFGVQVVRREQSAHSNRLVDAGECLASEITIQFDFLSSFGCGTNTGDLLHCF